MSRAVNVTATTNDVETLCARHSIAISTLEALPAGGARVVLVTMADAEALRARMKGKLIQGPVNRSGLYMARPPVAPIR